MNRHQYFLNFDDGVKQTNLTVADVLEFEAKYPAPPEQKKIGLLFKAIDNDITLHQREQSNNFNKAQIKIALPNQHLCSLVLELCASMFFLLYSCLNGLIF